MSSPSIAMFKSRHCGYAHGTEVRLSVSSIILMVNKVIRIVI